MTEILGWLFQKGATPVLERSMKFSEARHRLILSNVANADTPGYRRLDLDKPRFNRMLEDAIEEREQHHPGQFRVRQDFRVPMDDRGQFMTRYSIATGGEGPLRHDENNVSMEREMALMAQNAGGFNRAAALLRKSYQQIRSAIAERPQG